MMKVFTRALIILLGIGFVLAAPVDADKANFSEITFFVQ